MAQHPYSFSTPDEPALTRSQRRSAALAGERSAGWDGEAPATAHDWDFESKESRAPLYVAGIAATAILGGLLWLGGAFQGEPELSATAVTETAPRQGALSEMLDAQALDRARTAIIGLAPSVADTSSAPVEVEAAPEPATTADSVDAASVGPSATGGTSVEPNSAEPSSPPVPNEAVTTPAAEPTSTPAILLDRDNPYTSEDESTTVTDVPESRTPSEPSASDNPY